MIRPARAEDASRLAEINVFGWRSSYRGLIPDRFLFTALSAERSALWFREKIAAGSRIRVFEGDDIVKGFAESLPSRDADCPEAYELAMLYVETVFARQGVGSALIAEFEAVAAEAGYRRLILWTLEGNRAAVSFYASRGFAPDGARKYDGRIDAHEIRLAKSL